MNRDCQSDLISYAKTSIESGANLPEAYIALNEAKRIAPLDPGDQELLSGLSFKVADDSTVQDYLAKITKVTELGPIESSKILVITNIFPPQELGGFGKQLWEFSRELINRGNEVKVITANVPDLHSESSAKSCNFENRVDRSLMTYADWKKMPVEYLQDKNSIVKMSAHNYIRSVQVVDEFKPDYCMIGNLEMVGHSIFKYLIKHGIPILHICGNSNPGYLKLASPTSPLYRFGPCSNWTGENLVRNGFSLYPYYTLYPGSALEDYYLHLPPLYDKLRIACACLLMSRKGVHVLINALVFLKESGIDFMCEIAGGNAETGYREYLESFVEEQGLADKVFFIGLQNNEGLRRLYRRSNVFVFPTVDEEPFGKSSIEAMAAGLLTISSGTGGQSEIFKEQEAGLLFEANNPEDLSNKFTYLQRNPDEWKRLALQGQRRAFDFTLTGCVAPVVSIFKEIKDQATSESDLSEFTNYKEAVLQECRQSFEHSMGLFESGDDSQTLEEIEKIHEDKGIAYPLILKGICFIKRKNYPRAYNLILNSIMYESDNWASYACMGITNYHLGQFQESYTCFEISAHMSGGSKRFYVILAALLRKHNSPEDAQRIQAHADSLKEELNLDAEHYFAHVSSLLDEFLESLSLPV